MRIIVDNVTLDLDDKICKAFENRLYPVSAEECKMYITEEYHMPVMDAVKKYGITTVTNMLNAVLKMESEV